MIKHIKCDIFKSGADIILHQVNCQGEMNSGIAKQVKEKYPKAYEWYKTLCDAYKDNPSELLGHPNIVPTEIGYIVNVFAQENFGYDGKCYTDHKALRIAFETIVKIIDYDSKLSTIAIPYLMGCDRGGGDWNVVYKMIEETFKDYDVLICEYDGSYMFDATKVKNECVQWIRDWFSVNGPDCNAIVGISGGKDSSVVAALCVEALGKDRVIGVMMPNGVQSDIKDSVHIVDHLGIRSINVNIQDAYQAIMSQMGLIFIPNLDGYANFDVSEQTKVNLGPRLRMATLYAVAQSLNGRVANTCNLSEDWVGYSTRWGDSVGDFSPLSQLTSDEVVAIGDACGLPYELTHKTPSDGLCGKTDEDNLGFTYEVLNKYIRTGVCEDEETKNKIDAMHQKNLFKLEMMPSFPYKEG